MLWLFHTKPIPSPTWQKPSYFLLRRTCIINWIQIYFVKNADIKKDDFQKYNVARTNKLGVSFLLSHFPDKQILYFELVKSDIDPRENALHLDCCFQPIGDEMAIMYKEGFKHLDDVNFLVNLFPKF